MGQPTLHYPSDSPAAPADDVGGLGSQSGHGLPESGSGFDAYPCGLDSKGAMAIDCFHARAHLPDDREALLVDTGARKGLGGSEWVDRVERVAQQYDMQVTRRQLSRPMEVRGVGKKPQEITEEATVPGCLEDGDPMDFTLSVVPDSALPALMGLDTLERLHGIVDNRIEHRKLYLGSDVVITPGPKTKTLQLYPAESGHLMLPITHFKHLDAGHRRPSGAVNAPTRHLGAVNAPRKAIAFHEEGTDAVNAPTQQTPATASTAATPSATPATPTATANTWDRFQ